MDKTVKLQDAMDVLDIFRRNTEKVMGEDDIAVKTIDTCKLLISELEPVEEGIRI